MFQVLSTKDGVSDGIIQQLDFYDFSRGKWAKCFLLCDIPTIVRCESNKDKGVYKTLDKTPITRNPISVCSLNSVDRW